MFTGQCSCVPASFSGPPFAECPGGAPAALTSTRVQAATGHPAPALPTWEPPPVQASGATHPVCEVPLVCCLHCPPPPLPFISAVLPALKPLALYFAPCPLHLFYFYDSHYFLKFTFLTTHVVCRPPPTGRRVQQTGTPHQGGGPRDLGGGREGAGQVLPSAKLQASVTGRGLEQFNLYFPIYSA